MKTSKNKKFFFDCQHIGLFNEVIEFIRTREIFALFITNNITFLEDNRKTLNQ